MGHAHSKKKKHKNSKELADYINRNVPNADYYTIDKLSHCSEPFMHSSSFPQSRTKQVIISHSFSKRSGITHDNSKGSAVTHDIPKGSGIKHDNSKGSVVTYGPSKESLVLEKNNILYKDIQIDDHPALTKLQNEQNDRLEKMEARMTQIRLHAMQEAERRKYAYLFKARTRQSPTKDLLIKAREKIFQKTSICDEKESKTTESLNKVVDSGEIIPVTVVKESPTKSTQKIQKSNVIPALDNISLNNPKTILLLPFLLPIFLLLFMVRSISQSDRWNKEEQKKN